MKCRYLSVTSLGLIGILFVLVQGSNEQGQNYLDSAHRSAHIIHKRNTWWSKKSTGDRSRLASMWWNKKSAGDPYDTPIEQDIASESRAQEVHRAIDCYDRFCTDSFLACVTRSGADVTRCRLEHRLCATKCFMQDKGLPLEGN